MKRMINLKEIRIDNFILLEIYPDLPRWHKIQPKDIFDISEGKITLNSINQIPLTPEILEKCGFIKKSNQFFKDFKGGCIEIYNSAVILFVGDEYTLNVAMDYESITLPFEIEYLHKLQNLYFTLTGCELEVNI